MYKKILVALDNTAISESVFEQGLKLAQAMSANLMLVHVLTSEEEGSPFPIPPGMEATYWVPASEMELEIWKEDWARFETACLETLRTYSRTANAAGVNAEFRQLVGHPGRSICQIARAWGAQLVIVGNHGRSGLSEFFLGSVSNYVLHHAPCAVLVIKSDTGDEAESTTRQEQSAIAP
jgi:nucleotide-binding universal stress UspA family protein